MKLNEVPQEKKTFKDGGNAPKKVLYAVKPDGTYTQSISDGWEPENLALAQAWEEIELQLQAVLQDVHNGVKSPVAYYMVRERMDIGILAAYIGKWQWQVKRHLKPGVFSKLSLQMLERYAAVFNISVGELKNPAK